MPARAGAWSIDSAYGPMKWLSVTIMMRSPRCCASSFCGQMTAVGCAQLTLISSTEVKAPAEKQGDVIFVNADAAAE